MGNTNAKRVSIDNRDIKDNDYKAKELQTAMEEIDFRRETKEPTGILDRTQSTIEAIEATRTFTITPVGDSFKYFIRGEEFVIDSAQSVVWGDVEGTWFFHFDSTGTFIATQTPWDFELPIAFVSIVYWDATNKECVIFGEERHGLVMDWATHKRLHEATGAEIGREQFRAYNFLLREDGSLNSHAEFAVLEGSFYDEDIRIDVVDTPTPINQSEQTLSPQAKIPIYYKVGSEANPQWRKIPAINAPIATDTPSTTPFYNELVGGNWQLSNVTENYYIVQTICVTNDLREPVIALLSPRETQAVADVTDNLFFTEELKGLPFPEIVPVDFAIYQCNSSYGNDYNARLIQIANAEELKKIRDRYVVTSFYGGNANNGRVLEFVDGIDSEEQPILIPDDSFIVTVTVQASSNIATGRRIGFFEINDLVNPVFEVTIPGGNDSFEFDVSEFFAQGSRISVRVTIGSISKPTVRFWVETINI